MLRYCVYLNRVDFKKISFLSDYHALRGPFSPLHSYRSVYWPRELEGEEQLNPKWYQCFMVLLAFLGVSGRQPRNFQLITKQPVFYNPNGEFRIKTVRMRDVDICAFHAEMIYVWACWYVPLRSRDAGLDRFLPSMVRLP
ncbi:hypothetical protein GQ43DRAFT_104925 [Delitschia confertaspora ATCC 74209]|uniref:Uncharacterized protein n=1 Tax=Delitschia confertaspora ATCC 74209 TaxID=1513339 RepID=A0A9P4JMX3_9PLEO|nr:hypothetical protein GQ43DRAFT_104925 [Delitschia confertaspora ATCC 74209]